MMMMSEVGVHFGGFDDVWDGDGDDDDGDDDDGGGGDGALENEIAILIDHTCVDFLYYLMGAWLLWLHGLCYCHDGLIKRYFPLQARCEFVHHV